MSAWKRQKTTGSWNSGCLQLWNPQAAEVRWKKGAPGASVWSVQPNLLTPPRSSAQLTQGCSPLRKAVIYWAYFTPNWGTQSAGGGYVTNEITQQTRRSLCFPRLWAQSKLQTLRKPSNSPRKSPAVALRLGFRLAGDRSSALLRPSVPPTIPSGCRCCFFFFFFPSSFSSPSLPPVPPAPSRPHPGPRPRHTPGRPAGRRKTERDVYTKHWPSAPTGCRRAANVPRSARGNSGVSYLRSEKGLTWARLCQWQLTWGRPAANHRAARPSGSYPLVKEFSSWRESYLWPTRSATFGSVTAQLPRSRRTPRRPAASERGPHVRGPPLSHLSG